MAILGLGIPHCPLLGTYFMTYFRLRVFISRQVKKVPDREILAHHE